MKAWYSWFRDFLQKGDVFAILVCLGLIGGSFFFSLVSESPSLVRIDWDGTTMIYPLDEERSINLDNSLGYNLIYIDGKGSISISDADCKDQLCVSMGPIDRTGQYMACLPHRLFITIMGEEDSPVDGEVW